MKPDEDGCTPKLGSRSITETAPRHRISAFNRPASPVGKQRGSGDAACQLTAREGDSQIRGDRGVPSLSEPRRTGCPALALSRLQTVRTPWKRRTIIGVTRLRAHSPSRANTAC